MKAELCGLVLVAASAACATTAMAPGRRISGEAEIRPDDETTQVIQVTAMGRVSGTFKVCVNPDGNVADITILKSTSYPRYDAKLLRRMKEDWRYRPIEEGGKPIRFCTGVTFEYDYGQAATAEFAQRGAMEKRRLAGTLAIEPDTEVVAVMVRDHATKVTGVLRVCHGVDGVVNTAELIRTTGYPVYDQRLADEIKRTWKFSPFLVSGSPAPMCSPVTFVYSVLPART